jgi:hypothetical protein
MSRDICPLCREIIHLCGHQPNPTLNTILDDKWLSFVHGRPRLSAPKDVKKDVKSVGREASTEGSQEMRMAYCPPSARFRGIAADILSQVGWINRTRDRAEA